MARGMRVARWCSAGLMVAGLALVPFGASKATADPPQLRAEAACYRGADAATMVFAAQVRPAAPVEITIYRGGRTVGSFKKPAAARHRVAWRVADRSGRALPVGTYEYRVTARSDSGTADEAGAVVVPAPSSPDQDPVATSSPDPGEGAEPSGETTPAPDASGSAAGSSGGAPPGSSAQVSGEAGPVPSRTAVPRDSSPTVRAASDRPWFGLYLPGVPASVAPLESLESKVGARADVVNFFIADKESFPRDRCARVAAHGSVPLVTLEFWSARDRGVRAIADGSKDTYLRRFARDAKAYGGEVWLRPFHEMNGDWYPWSGTAGPNTPADVVAAWKRVDRILDEEGASNVRLVWCVNADSVPNTRANSIASYWPGEASVDLVAIDGYNFGTSASWSSWRSFSDVFGSAYATVAGLTRKPLFVAETASAERGGDKAAWVAGAFDAMATRYPRIEGVVWFSADKEADWRINSSSASLSAYKRALSE